METMNYYCKKDVSLADIADLAIYKNYEIGWLNLPIPIQLKQNRLLLDIIFKFHDKASFWQCTEMKLDELYFDTEDALERLRNLKTKRIFLFEYNPYSLPELSEFLAIILNKYDGWFDCNGDVLNLYTIDNIKNISQDCP